MSAVEIVNYLNVNEQLNTHRLFRRENDTIGF